MNEPCVVNVDERTLLEKYEGETLVGIIEVFNNEIIRSIDDPIELEQYLEEKNNGTN